MIANLARRGWYALAGVLVGVTALYSTSYCLWAAYVDTVDDPRSVLAAVLLLVAAVLPVLCGVWRYRRRRHADRPLPAALRSAALVYAAAGIVVLLPAALIAVG